MEESLLEQFGLLQSVVQNAPLPIGVYVGEDLKIVLANETMIATWGKGPEVLGKRYTEILPELENQELFDQARTVLKTGIPFDAKNKRVDLIIDGLLKTHYFNYSFIPLKNPNGTVYGIMNSGTDVTDLVLARYNTEQAEQKLRLALDAGELGTYVSNLATSEVITSESFNKIWGISGKLKRSDIVSKIYPEDIPIREAAHTKAAVSGNVCYEVRVQKGKLLRWVRVKGKIIEDETGNPINLIGVVQDITEQKEFSEELKKLVEERTSELQRSNEDLLQFANIVSHDLKEPVRKISFFNTMLKNELGSTIKEKSRAYLDKVQQSTQRMTSVIDGVLNYSTLNKSGHKVQRVNLDKIIDEIKTDLELIIQEKKAILILDPLPEIEGAPVLLHQLFYNLIHNALKFSRPDDPPRVTIASELETIDKIKHIRIIIRDNGVGFDHEYSQKIFNAFERLHTKDEFEGTGLGLALCKKIVERHSGTIEASGNKNEGAVFIVSLPIMQKNKSL